MNFHLDRDGAFVLFEDEDSLAKAALGRGRLGGARRTRRMCLRGTLFLYKAERLDGAESRDSTDG